ncbi:heavy-metal-associated domain-containing protein [Aureitalea sp. L0-47]|uniref:heavy-metal-associated domain-containing protein n=1 Tax=Aureitalea sp. L0-47 TaxID=2816962 RepID=UPI0022386F13|nr:heavy metal-associated domain-containing protein [Aureitalea sp. L0-47]MCW5518723.1 heavy-metal-associated domain-containing protein [Aureitalea sp. L0-47]
MKRTYTIAGMTCEGCKASVAQALESLSGVTDIDVNLESGEAVLNMANPISLAELQRVLSPKYSIHESGNLMSSGEETSKLKQLRPLFLIFVYLVVSVLLLHYKNLSLDAVMLDFMGLFFVVFSFFKVLDLKGFPSSFGMYDPLAKLVPVYGWIYPFIEIILGLMFLLRFEVGIALIITIVILGITTIGVTRTLLNKKKIKCACLGTALKLPMTEATFIENAVMIVMAVIMLFKTPVL